MANVSGLSNFEIFQQVLYKSNEKPSAGKSVAQPLTTGELLSIQQHGTSSQTESIRASSYSTEDYTLPFLRQTLQWDHESQRQIELWDAPNEEWTTWESVSTKTSREFWVRQQREFTRSGEKVKDCLVFRYASQIIPGKLADMNRKERHRHHDRKAHLKETTMGHECYRDLFFEIVDSDRRSRANLSNSAIRTLEVLCKFIDDIFPGARDTLEAAYQDKQITYSKVWKLYPPGRIVYEKRQFPVLNKSYEQCFRVRTADDYVSHHDGTNVFRLVLEEIIYMRDTRVIPGTRLVLTSRHIREYQGLRNITTEDLGVVPLDIISQEKQRNVCTAIVQRSRQFLHLSKLPFSIWNYKGPVRLVNRITGRGTLEETKLSQAERAWQRHTHENVVIDLQSSTDYFNDRFPGLLHSFHDADGGVEKAKPLRISRIEPDNNHELEDGNYKGHFLLICRGYLPAYLISSRVYAVNILVSELCQPVWDQQHHWESPALSFRDESYWHTLLQAYFEEKDVDTKLGRRQTRGAGLVLVLQGSKILTRMVANNISARLKRPLVSLSLAEEDQRLSEASKVSLRWGGVLHIEEYGASNNQPDPRELASHFSFYPSVVLVTCNDITALGTACESEIDGIIECNRSPDDPIPELWKLYFTTELPEVTASISEQRLNDACRILAQLEPHECRMGKTLKTAKRVAIAETSVVGLGHVLAVIRSSLSVARLEEVKDILAAADELRGQSNSTVK